MLDRAGRSPLHYAALNNDLDEISRLVSQGLDVNLQDNQGFTPLHFAAQENAEEATKLLLSLGAFVETENKHGNTPLWTAVYNSDESGKIITALLEAGADRNHANKSGSSPIKLANLIGNKNVKKFF